MITLPQNVSTKITIPIGLTCLLGAIILIFIVPQQFQANAVADAANNAKSTVNLFKTLRKYYVENIVSKVKGSDVKLSFNHKGVDSTIPLPATLIHDMSEMLADSGTAIKLYSQFPFPNRTARELDAFGEQAWAYFQSNPDGIFQRTEERDGMTVSRVAIADKMVSAGCVNCHNSHPLTPKVGWKLGDVRGVLEVETQIDQQIANGIEMSKRIGLILAAIVGVILLAIFFSIKYWVVKPLSIAVQVAGNIASGDLENEIEVKSKDEVGEFLDALATMQSNLKNSIEHDHSVALESLRIKQALDNVSANVMMADANNNIIYLNDSVIEMFTNVQDDILTGR